MRIVDPKDLVQLLRAEVEKVGSQAAWAKKHGVARTSVNRILKGAKPFSEDVIRALGLRIVFVSDVPANGPWRRLLHTEFERWQRRQG